DADQGRAVLTVAAVDALAVLAVAERAADQEELTALLDQFLVGLGGLVGVGGGQDGLVEAAHHEKPEQHDHEARSATAAVPRQSACGAVQETHEFSPCS